MNNPFNSALKTDLDILRILRKAHLELVEIDPSYMPDDVYEKKSEYEKILLENIWTLSKKLDKRK